MISQGLLLGVLVHVTHSQDTLCVQPLNYTDCSPTPNEWAVNLDYVTLSHKFFTASSTFIISYQITVQGAGTPQNLCSYQYYSGTCQKFGASPTCVRCSNNIAADGYAESVFTVDDLNTAKNQSTVSYQFGTSVDILQFMLKECQGTYGDATSVNPLPDPCGYGCTTQFECVNAANVDSSNRTCTAKAQWDPPPTCIPETTTEDIPISTTIETTQDNSNPESTTSQAESTTSSSSSNATQGSDCGECDYCCTKQPDAAIAITVIGCLFVAVEIGIAIYSFINKPGVQYAEFLYGAFVVCAVAWIASVIVLFVGDCTCTADNCTCAAYIAGATIGGISIAGMAVSIGFLIRAIAAIECK